MTGLAVWLLLLLWLLPMFVSVLLWSLGFALRVSVLLVQLAAIAIGCLAWLGWFIVRPKEAMAAYRAA